MLLLHAAAVLAVAATTWLGLWQLHAWQSHRADRVAELAAEVASRPPRDLSGVLGPDDPFPEDAVGAPVRLQGRWVQRPWTYVGPRELDGRTGTWVLGLLAVCPPGPCARASAIPVVLGWTDQAPAQLSRLPGRPAGRTPDASAGAGRTIGVVGWLQPGEGSLTDDDPGDGVLPSVRIAELLQLTDRDLYTGYLILDQPTTARGDLSAVTPDSLPGAPAGVGLRNLLYGVQWFCFGAFAVFLWLRWCRDETSGARGVEDRGLASES